MVGQKRVLAQKELAFDRHALVLALLDLGSVQDSCGHVSNQLNTSINTRRKNVDSFGRTMPASSNVLGSCCQGVE